MGDDPVSKERPGFRLGAIADGKNLKRQKLAHRHLEKTLFRERTNFAVLHNVSLPQPSLIKRFARGVNDMTQSILFGQHEHGVQQTLHSATGLDQSGAEGNREGR